MFCRKLVWIVHAFSYHRMIAVLICTILLLQAFIMLIVMKLDRNTNPKYQSHSNAIQEHKTIKSHHEIKELYQNIVDRINKVSIMDSSGGYFIVPDIIRPQGNQSEKPVTGVTVCTQTTPNHLRYLPALSDSWSGPVSVSVFTHSKYTMFAIYSIIFLHMCFVSVRTHVTFHLAFPIAYPPPDLSAFVNMTYRCNDEYYLQLNKERENYAIHGLEYPHNVLRNIAVSNSRTSHVLVIDIDMLPSKDLYQQSRHFLLRHSSVNNGQNELIAYVVPSFESKLTNITSVSKHSLLQEWDKSNVRPFYGDICQKCQTATDYDQWRGLWDVSFLDVGYYTDWSDPWEPFYIANRSALPRYDGRFKQYGFNRISQVCEMYVAGYRFAVLNNAFLVHRGFKQAGGFHSTKDQEQEKNRELFQEFKKELKNHYPDANREC